MIKDLIIVKDAVPLSLLDQLRNQAEISREWAIDVPVNFAFKDRFPKITLVDGGPKSPAVSAMFGLAWGILALVREKCPEFKLDVYYAGISVKDRHREDNIHVDHDADLKDIHVVKVLGILNTDWKEDWGGGFHWNGKDYYAPPGSFYVFNPRIKHGACDIHTDEKRLAVDFAVESTTKKIVKCPY